MALSPTDHIPYSPYSPASSQNSPSTLTPLSSASSSPPNIQLPLSSTYAPSHQPQQPQHQHLYHQQHAYQYEQDEKEHYSGSPVTSEPTDLEGKVAGMIVGARKSWKNVKGRTERVWPTELEASLVRGEHQLLRLFEDDIGLTQCHLASISLPCHFAYDGFYVLFVIACATFPQMFPHIYRAVGVQTN